MGTKDQQVNAPVYLRPATRTLLADVAKIAALAMVYFCSGKLGLRLAFLNQSATAVWPPTGIALAAVLLLGYRIWPGIWLGAFLVNLTTDGSLLVSSGIAVGNTLEALLGGWLVEHFANGRRAFERTRDIFLYLLLAAVLSTSLSATFGVTTLVLGGFAPLTQYFPVWTTWWLGDMVSSLIITPVLVLWTTTPSARWNRQQIFEALLVLALVVFTGSIVFANLLAPVFHHFPFAFLCVPPLLWATFRFGQRGAVAAAFALSVVALYGTLHGLGPFSLREPNEALLLLQAFMGIVTVSNLLLGAVVSERQQTIDALHEAEKKEQTRLIGNLAVTRILAESPTLSDATPKILQTICETLGWELGGVWIPDSDANVLRCLRIWHVPSANVEKFESACYERAFAPGVGLPGRVWKSLRPAWIPDVTKDDNFPRVPIAIAEGLHTAFGFPILFGETFLGVMEFFSHDIREPDAALLAMFGSIGSQIGQFMERKQAEQSQARLAAIVEFSDDAIVGKNLDGIVTSWNVSAERLFGYRAFEIVGQPILIIIPPDRQEEERNILTLLRQGKHVENYETVRVTKDGRQVPVSLTISPIKDSAGKIVGASKIARDITERKLAEEALRDSEERFRTLAQTASDAIITIDEESTIIFVNPAAETVFGYTQQELRGAKLTSLMPPSFRAPHLAGFRRYRETGRRNIPWQAMELPGLHKDGREIPLEISFGEFTWNGRRFFTGIARDITERKQAEKALRHLAAIVESSEDAIIGKDLNGILTSWNAGAEKLYGYKADEVIGKSISLLMPSDREDEEKEILAKLRRGESITHFETVRVAKDGRRIDVSLTISAIKNAAGKVIGISKTARDITEAKKAEAELAAWQHELELRVQQRTAELATAHQQLQAEIDERKRLENEIANAVEHEQLRLGQELHDGLGQQLTGMGYMMTALQMKLKKLSPTRSREAKRLQDMIQQSVEQTRTLAKGFYPVELERHGLLMALVEVTSKTGQSSDIVYSVESDGDQTCVTLKGPPAIQLFRIAQEAVHNAVKHAKASQVMIRLARVNGSITLTVKDNGVGLPPDIEAAQGMGLRIMQYRARMIGGKLEFRNASEGGAVVTCSVPVTECLPLRPPTRPASAGIGSSAFSSM